MQEKITIYQVLPRLYGNKAGQNLPHGTIEQNGCGKMADFTDEVLANIRDFGFTHIWYTGLLEHATQTDYSACGIRCDHPAVVKGRAGSPYAIKDYYDIDPDLAVKPERRMKEFEALLRRTHKAGMKVVIDFVPNHVARQYFSDAKPARVKDLGEGDDMSLGFSANNNFYYIQGQTLHTDFTDVRAADGPYREYPAKATGNDCFNAWPSRNDWYETVKLNYGVDYMGGRTCHFDPVPSTWTKMTDILLFWAKKGVDAFRCDMAEMVPCEFWAYAIAKVKTIYPAVLFIAEVYNPGLYYDYIHRGGFDFLYDKVGLYDTLRAVVRGEASASCITGCWQSIDGIRCHMLNFLENHDEQRITSPFFAGEALRAVPALVVSALMGTNPFMVYAGQEVGEAGMDSEGFSGIDGRTTIFDYWCVDSLRRLSTADRSLLTEDEVRLYYIYRQVMRLANGSEAVREGIFYDLMYANYDRTCGFNPDRQYAFIRKGKEETLLIVANFDAADIYVGVRVPAHAFSFMDLRGGLYAAIDLLSGETQTVELKPDGFTMVAVAANSAVVLKIEG